MKLEEVTVEIDKLTLIKSILEKLAENEAHFIFKTYIETESLERTRKIITGSNIVKDDGNKYQVNDISLFIKKGTYLVDEDTQKLAQTILKRNSIKR